LNRRELDPTVEGGALQFDSYLQTQIKILQTERLLGGAADRLHLEQAAEFRPQPGLADRIKRMLHIAPHAADRSARDRLLAAMAHRLTVRLSGDTRIIEVVFEAHDPALAAAVANELAAGYIDENLQKRLRATEYTARFLGRQLQELKGNLEQAEH